MTLDPIMKSLLTRITRINTNSITKPIVKLFEQKLTKGTKMRNLRYAIYDLRDHSNARGIIYRISPIANFESPHVVSY